jgi:hypothetical protein
VERLRTHLFNSLIKVQGIGRFRLISPNPRCGSTSPPEFDPQNPPPGFEITDPAGFGLTSPTSRASYRPRGG